MRRWSLGQLTVIGVRPAELIEIAARAGYDAVCPLVGLIPIEGLPLVPLRAGDPDTTAMAASLKANGIDLQNADGFVLTGQDNFEDILRLIELTAEMGAPNVNAIIFDQDISRGQANLARLDSIAQSFGMTVTLEFMEISPIGTPQAAMDVIAGIGSNNVSLMLDTLHLAQSGFSAARVRDYGPSAIGAAQLCDAPAQFSFEEYRRMAIEERWAPGEGGLPVKEFMAALPADMTCAVEVPRLDEPDLQARAARILTLARKIDQLASAG